jgi:hypothetical protein
MTPDDARRAVAEYRKALFDAVVARYDAGIALHHINSQLPLSVHELPDVPDPALLAQLEQFQDDVRGLTDGLPLFDDDRIDEMFELANTAGPLVDKELLQQSIDHANDAAAYFSDIHTKVSNTLDEYIDHLRGPVA